MKATIKSIIAAAIIAIAASSCTKNEVPKMDIEFTTANLWFTLPPVPTSRTWEDYFVNVQVFSDSQAVVKYFHASNGKWYTYTCHVSGDGHSSDFVYSIEQNSAIPQHDTVVVYRSTQFSYPK